VSVQAFQTVKETPKIEITTEMIEQAITQIVKVAAASDNETPFNVDEEAMIKAIQSKNNLSKETINKLSETLNMQSSLMVNLRVFLLEVREDYINSFKLNL
jgi:hypothetical protein